MADYDWFTPTEQEMKQRAAYRQRLADLSFEEKGYGGDTLVCALCGCVIYGRLGDKYAKVHRERCFVQERVEGKHRLD